MLAAALCVMLSLSAGEWDARVATVSSHADRLEAFVVEEGAAAEKTARLAALRERLGAGADSAESFAALYTAFDETRAWLLAHSQERPAVAEGVFEETQEHWRITTKDLTLTWRRDTLGMEVSAGGQTWAFGESDKLDIQMEAGRLSLKDARSVRAERLFTGWSAGLVVSFSDFEKAPGFALHVSAHCEGPEVVFDLAAEDTDAVLKEIRWPKPLLTDKTPGDVAVIPRMQGMLLPGDWPQHIQSEETVNSRTHYMPWWGHLRNGRGAQAIIETPFDAAGYYVHPEGGPTRAGVAWQASLGRMAYLRTVRYVFSENATHVTLAKRYRRHVIERGDFVSLREKEAATPALAEVVGRPVVHLGALYHFVPQASMYNKETPEANHSLNTFDRLRADLEGLKAAGIDSAYVHLDGWGYYGYDDGHPDVIPAGVEQGGAEGLRALAAKCAEMGYFFAVHDQYRDFYLNAASFDERLTLTHLNGKRDEHSVWCGGPQTFLNPRFAPGYVRRNHDWFVENGIPVRGAYLDVFSVVPPEESARKAHPTTRAESALYRRQCFDVLKARGYVVSSEEPTDYFAGTLHLVHHGPYATHPHIGGGAACAIPVPLFNLVYHDSLMTPWEMGEDGGWGIPKGDSGRIHCLLNAGMPYVGPGADAAAIARVKEACALQETCAFAEMTDHRFLDDTRRKQETTFSNGVVVRADFDAKTAEVVYPEK